MPGSVARSTLHVEGDDDFHSILHLLRHHSIDYDPKPWPATYPVLNKIGSVEALLQGMEVATQVSGGRAIGFVLDADSPIMDRWNAVRARLANVDLNPPAQPIPSGFIGTSKKYNARVGIWLMPDNQEDGTLEHFLRQLIAQGDILIDHAQSATVVAKQLGAAFADVDELKARLAAWLAWQAEPGLPYGTAIRAKFFGHDSSAALAFVAWFRDLYSIAP